jgi:hypothetical protein
MVQNVITTCDPHNLEVQEDRDVIAVLASPPAASWRTQGHPGLVCIIGSQVEENLFPRGILPFSGVLADTPRRRFVPTPRLLLTITVFDSYQRA